MLFTPMMARPASSISGNLPSCFHSITDILANGNSWQFSRKNYPTKTSNVKSSSAENPLILLPLLNEAEEKSKSLIDEYL